MRPLSLTAIHCIALDVQRVFRVQRKELWAVLLRAMKTYVMKHGWVAMRRFMGGASVSGIALVKDNACISNGAIITDVASVSDSAIVKGDVWIGGFAKISDSAVIKYSISNNGDPLFLSGRIVICGNAVIESNYDYIVFKNWWSSGRYFTWTRCNDMWSVGCFYGTGNELIAKAYKDSNVSGREYERVVKYVEQIKRYSKPSL